MGRWEVKIGLMNTFEWHGPGHYLESREDAVTELVDSMVDHLCAIAYVTDNPVAVRDGENGDSFVIDKRSRPIDLRDTAARLLEAEKLGRDEPA